MAHDRYKFFLPRTVPAILLASRFSAEDRRRSERAGAAAYIVKSEFYENEPLGRIRLLAGPQ